MTNRIIWEWSDSPVTKVPLVVYDHTGERTVVGTAEVNTDGSFTGKITDENLADALSNLGIGSFSLVPEPATEAPRRKEAEEDAEIHPPTR
jgi:hypothetical protein